MAAVVVSGVTLLLTYALVILGGWVHNTGSSLACPDWPLCYGQVMPEMVGGVAIEHSHRLLASTVGLFTIALVIVTRRLDPRTFKLSLLALALVVFQGALGGITVVYKLPGAVSTAHLATSMVFLALVAWIALRAWGAHAGAPVGPVKGADAVRNFVLGVTVVTYVQAVVGALVRHSSAGLACNVHILSCNGTLVPADGPGQLHWFHRLLAMVVVVLVLSMAVRVFRSTDHRGARRAAATAAVLVLVQVLLGILSVTSYLGRLELTLHLGGGAALLGSLFVLSLLTAPPRVLGVEAMPR